ncbi:MAG: DUF4168 domain-containing protein [Balneolaceae bacterium]|nr:DUF4168 domain-containing protein [Balneolaceae bacterium]
MIVIKRSVSLFLLLFVAVSAVYAQGQQQPQPATPDSVTDEELKQFAAVTDAAQSIRQEVQQEVQTLVEEQGMDYGRFQKIMMNRQNPNASGEVETTAEEEKKINSIQPQLMQINKEARQEFVQLIQNKGFTPQRFQEIMRAVQMSAELQKRLGTIQAEG